MEVCVSFKERAANPVRRPAKARLGYKHNAQPEKRHGLRMICRVAHEKTGGRRRCLGGYMEYALGAAKRLTGETVGADADGRPDGRSQPCTAHTVINPDQQHRPRTTGAGPEDQRTGCMCGEIRRADAKCRVSKPSCARGGSGGRRQAAGISGRFGNGTRPPRRIGAYAGHATREQAASIKKWSQ